MIRLLILFIFSFSVSCSFNPKSESGFIETVNIDKDQSNIETDITDKSEHNTYGPVFEEPANSTEEKSKRVPVLAIDLTPSLYASFAYLSLLRELEKKQIYPNVINTSSFTLVVATLYAKYRSVNKVEWKIFSLLKELKNLTIFTGDWYDEIEKFLEKEFKNKRIEQFKILITIPEGKNSKKLIKTGRVVNVLMNSMRISKKTNFINQPHLSYRSKIQNLGVDLYFSVNTLPRNFSFKIPNGFVWGLYTRVSGMMHNDDQVYFIGHQLSKIDMVPNLSDLFGSSSNSVREISEKIIDNYEDWLNKNN